LDSAERGVGLGEHRVEGERLERCGLTQRKMLARCGEKVERLNDVHIGESGPRSSVRGVHVHRFLEELLGF
jgi:hypothetical protein